MPAKEGSIIKKGRQKYPILSKRGESREKPLEGREFDLLADFISNKSKRKRNRNELTKMNSTRTTGVEEIHVKLQLAGRKEEKD